MKLAIWATSPSPHQSDFYAALRNAGVDLRVRYFQSLRESRRAMGWATPETLPDGESLLEADSNPLDSLEDSQDRVHIVPGYAYRTSRKVWRRLSVLGIPWVHWSEASMPSWRTPLLWPGRRHYAAQVNRYALGAFSQGSLAAADFVRWGIRRDRIANLYYSMRHTPALNPDAELQAYLRGRRAIVYVGSLIERKRPITLIRAFAKATSGRDDVALVVVGDGPLRLACQQECARLGAIQRIHFCGSTPMNRISALLACCDVLVLPSRHDGWGMALNEGAAAGLALVATDRVGAAHHVIAAGENGMLCRASDVGSLTSALRPYVNDPDLTARHGAVSKNRLNDFLPEKNVVRCVEALRTWLAGDKRWRKWAEEWSTNYLAQHFSCNAA